MTEQDSPGPTAVPPVPTGTSQPDPAAAPPPAPLVPWDAPAATPPGFGAGASSYAGGPPPFTVGLLLSDTFARYGADLLRLFVVSAVASTLSWLTSFASVPMGTNPFNRPTGFVDVSGLLGLASFVVGIVSSSALFALAEGGRDVSFGRALRRAIERSGWLFLTSLLLGLGLVVLGVLALIPVALFAVISPAAAVIFGFVVVLVFIWLGLRLSLALPANVVDNHNSIDAIKLSWRATKPMGVWLRVLGAALLLGLLVLPAALGAGLLLFPAMFTGGGQLALLLLPTIAFALFTPLSALLSFSAYRRLVPPPQPSWTQSSAPAAPVPIVIDAPPPPPPAAGEPAALDATVAESSEPPPSIGAPDPSAGLGPTEPPFRVPPFGTAAKALLALALVFDVAGIAAIPYGVARMEEFVRNGFPGFPFPGGPNGPVFPGGNGAVVPGQVAFGRSADLGTCSVDGPLFFATAGTQVEWIASFPQRVTPADEVFLRISRDGQELETTLQEPGTYDCLGADDPTPPLVEGIYTYEVVVNGSISATGSLFVQ